MALNKIYWSQIETETIPIGSTVNFGSITGSINDVYATDLWISGTNIQDYIKNTSIWQQTGSYYATTNDLEVTGSLTIKGNLLVEGSTTLVQNDPLGDDSLIVSGVMNLVRSEIKSASLYIENLGTLADTSKQGIIDLGFF